MLRWVGDRFVYPSKMTSSAITHLSFVQRLRFRTRGVYGARLYLPFSIIALFLRRWSRRLRGKKAHFEQETRLPQISWTMFVEPSAVGLLELEKKNGNVRISEVAVLAHLAAACPAGATIFEIGTFDGRTSLNLSLNAPFDSEVHTLDLPRDMDPAMELAPGEAHMVDKAVSGSRIEAYREMLPEVTGRITQHFGDSATYDFSAFSGKCALFFVDGSHAYGYLKSDTKVAMKALAPGGVIAWHDYGVWPGVTQGLEEIEERDGLGLQQIRGTSLVVWRKPRA